jgi:hypothetical protein
VVLVSTSSPGTATRRRGWAKVLSQITLDEMDRWNRIFAQKIEVMRIQLQCSACHTYANKDDQSCVRCGALFVEV